MDRYSIAHRIGRLCTAERLVALSFGGAFVAAAFGLAIAMARDEHDAACRATDNEFAAAFTEAVQHDDPPPDLRSRFDEQMTAFQSSHRGWHPCDFPLTRGKMSSTLRREQTPPPHQLRLRTLAQR